MSHESISSRAASRELNLLLGEKSKRPVVVDILRNYKSRILKDLDKIM
jgi:hypothetical protein